MPVLFLFSRVYLNLVVDPAKEEGVEARSPRQERSLGGRVAKRVDLPAAQQDTGGAKGMKRGESEKRIDDEQVQKKA